MSLLFRPVHQLGRSSDTSVSNVFSDTGVNYDLAIGGVPYILATSKDTPRIRRTAQYKKQQVDQSTEPGEQTIVQWWLKSQSTFHLGAGQKFIDSPAPGNENIRQLRYQNSTGVNPWTIGQVGLLNQTKLAFASSTGSLMTSDSDGSATQFLVAAGDVLTRVTETVASGVPTYTTSVVTWGGSGAITGLCTDGTYYYVSNASTLYRGRLVGVTPGAGTSIYTLPGSTSAIILGWVKARLVALVNIGGATPLAQVFSLESQPTGPPAVMPSPVYTHPNTEWEWSDLTEGPSAIYASGNAGNRSEILKFVLDTNGDMPTLTGGTGIAVFPPGERVLGMTGYLSAVLGVATSRGFHVGTFVAGSNGEVSMGPLSVDSTGLSGGVCGSDRFFYAAGAHVDGVAGLFRIDTSQQLTIKQFSYTPDQRFGWSTDLRAANDSEVAIQGSASVTSATGDGRLAFLVPGFGLYVEHPSRLVPVGTLQTSRIRFETLDPKLYRFVRLRGDGVNGATDSGVIAVSTSLTDIPGQTAGYLDVANSGDSGDLATNQPPAIYATLGFTLTRAISDVTAGPTLTGYQIKALPAQRRQRELILPLALFDKVLDSSGELVGGDGQALSKLLALEALEQSCDITTLQYLGPFADQVLTEFVVIDSIEYTELPDPNQLASWGGIAVVTLRTIT